MSASTSSGTSAGIAPALRPRTRFRMRASSSAEVRVRWFPYCPTIQHLLSGALMGSPWSPARLLPGPRDEVSSSASPWMKAEKCYDLTDKGALQSCSMHLCTCTGPCPELLLPDQLHLLLRLFPGPPAFWHLLPMWCRLVFGAVPWVCSIVGGSEGGYHGLRFGLVDTVEHLGTVLLQGWYFSVL